jgi:hypothetical protein
MTILSLASFLTWLLIHITHAWGLAWAWGWVFKFLLPYHSTFPSSLWCFFLYIEHWVELSHLLTFGVIYCICGQLLNPTWTHFLCCSHGGGMDYIPRHGSKCFCLHCKKHGVSRFTWSNPCPFITFPLIFSWTSWHHVISWWHLHLSWCSHHRSHLSRFGFSNCFISRDGHKNGDSSKGRILSQLTPNKHVLSPCHRGFWVHTPTSIWLSLWMC